MNEFIDVKSLTRKELYQLANHAYIDAQFFKDKWEETQEIEYKKRYSRANKLHSRCCDEKYYRMMFEKEERYYKTIKQIFEIAIKNRAMKCRNSVHASGQGNEHDRMKYLEEIYRNIIVGFRDRTDPKPFLEIFEKIEEWLEDNTHYARK